MTQKSSYGFGPTGLVAIEQHFPESARIINDDLAYPIAMRSFMAIQLALTNSMNGIRKIPYQSGSARQ